MHQLNVELVRIHQANLRREAEQLHTAQRRGLAPVWRRTVGHGLVELGQLIGGRRSGRA